MSIRSLLLSSPWVESSRNARLLYVTLLCLADKRGHVDACSRALADYSLLSLEEYAAAVAELSAPHPDLGNAGAVTATTRGFQLTRWQFDPRRLRDAARQKRYREGIGKR